MNKEKKEKRLKPKHPSIIRGFFIKIRNFIRSGKIYEFVVSICKWIALLVLDYSLVLFTVTYLIPSIGSVWCSIFSITYDMELVDLVPLWLMPNLFSTGVLFVADLILMKKLYHFISRYCKTLCEQHKKDLAKLYASKSSDAD